MAAVKTDRPGSTVSLVDTNGNHLDFTRLPLRAAPGDEAGLYAFAGRNAGLKRSGLIGRLREILSNGRERPVFFGEADSLMQRLERHELLDEARALGATALWIHFTPKTMEPERKRMVQSLIKAYQPPLNKLRYTKSADAPADPRRSNALRASEPSKTPAIVESPNGGPYRRREILLQGLAGSNEPAALPPPDRAGPQRIGSG